jgi:hypothetical protein
MSEIRDKIPKINPVLILKVKSSGNPLKYAQLVSKLLLHDKLKEIELAGVGHAISILLLTSSLLSEHIDQLHRLNTLAYKPCEFCTAPNL